ncbi:MAG: hypothetical protein KDK30_18370 [Leptospiraceae bacterium]|nr:hypothetical protein [Leptospiraceae bacterium]
MYSTTPKNPHWIAVGNAGTIVYSADQGRTWQTGNSGTGVDLHGIAYTGNNRWVAAGASGTNLVSIDGGRTWSAQAVLSGSPNVFGLAGDGNGKLLAVGTLNPNVHFSSDSGQNWSAVNSQIGAVKSMAGFVCNLWFTGSNGDISFSGDGLNFTISGNPFAATREDITCNPSVGRIVLISASGTFIWYSDDNGNNWTATGTPPSASRRSGYFLSSLFLAVGDDNKVSFSSDAVTWSESAVLPATNYNSLRYGNGVLVAAGNTGEIAYSIDNGTTWSRSTGLPATNLNAVAFGLIE